jgi:alpha-1,2-mannosyltransferase
MDSMNVHVDFDTFWRSADALWNGGDVYEAGGRVYNLDPPFWVVLFSPLGLLEPMFAYRVFVLITLLTSLGYLAWTASELRLRAGWAVVGVAMLLLSTPLQTTISIGQIYPFLALGLVATWVADRHEKPVIAGLALGLVIAIKPSLAPVVFWPLLRRQWRTLGAALGAGAATTLVGAVVAGPGATLEWINLLASMGLDGTWYNASLPGAASLLFMENKYAVPLATLPWAVTAARGLGILLLFLTAWKVRWDRELGLWALVAASLLASPVAWYDYLLLLGPGILVLLARGRVALALVLLALQAIPAQWAILWQGENTIVATLALTIYPCILLAHWLVLLLSARKGPTRTPEPVPEEAELALEVGK